MGNTISDILLCSTSEPLSLKFFYKGFDFLNYTKIVIYKTFNHKGKKLLTIRVPSKKNILVKH